MSGAKKHIIYLSVRCHRCKKKAPATKTLKNSPNFHFLNDIVLLMMCVNYLNKKKRDGSDKWLFLSQFLLAFGVLGLLSVHRRMARQLKCSADWRKHNNKTLIIFYRFNSFNSFNPGCLEIFGFSIGMKWSTRVISGKLITSFDFFLYFLFNHC